MAWNFAAQEWQVTPNKMGATPVFGSSGFGNDYNNYLWVAGEAFGNLVMGTMDNSYLIDSFVLSATGEELIGENFVQTFQAILNWMDPTLAEELGNLPSPVLGLVRGHGADLWRFPSADTPALPAITNGANNPLAYGFRSILSKDDLLVLGTANPMNLETDGPLWFGGWQLLNLTPSP